MFLKSIELYGFKSFARPTKINFSDDLTVIVGPNGAGKSNINDAFRWVLGESSKKNIRTKEYHDVIFAGSETEKPADHCEVTLVFNNDKKILNLNSKEIKIKRVLYRKSEDSEFYINNDQVRRKDIKNLFMDTGIGNLDLALISQGMVSKVTESKPEELRAIINEVAGISRFQQQKDESLNKLERVEQNLKIFEVKLSDYKKQMNLLSAQKTKAEKYLKIKDALNKIELPIIKYELIHQQEKLEELEREIHNSEKTKVSTNNQITELSEIVKNLSNKALDLDLELQKLQNSYNQILDHQRFDFNDSDDSVKKLTHTIETTFKSVTELRALVQKNNDLNLEMVVESGELEQKYNNYLSERERFNYQLNAVEYELTKQREKSFDHSERGIKNIIENRKNFDDVQGLVSDLIKYDKKFEVAVNVAMGNKLKNIVVRDDEVAKELIYFLKNNRLGTATFLPYTQVTPKYVSDDILNMLSKEESFFGTLASKLNINHKYKNVVDFLAGNILLFNDIEQATKYSKILGHKFIIVTIEGDIILPGYVIKGGYNEVREKKDHLAAVEQQHKEITKNITELNKKIDKHAEELRNLRFKIQENANEKLRIGERINYLEQNLSQHLESYKHHTGENYKFSRKESTREMALNLKVEESPEVLLQKIKSAQHEKQKLSHELLKQQEKEDSTRKAWQNALETHSNSVMLSEKLRRAFEENKNILIKDYKLTVESLLEDDKISKKTPNDDLNERRAFLRKEFAEIGFVNIESIEQYNAIEAEYDVLHKNVKDLVDSKEKLMSVLKTLDDEMKHTFIDTFEKVNNSLAIVFNVLFGGGKAKLFLTNPENILETGIEFHGQTPGKVVKNMSLYSGGEKALMAMALFFAINEVKNLPLFLLDEVEASLDETNVERFAKFAKKINTNGTQVVITSHRPGTMEQADVLFGVTMQPKGISKVVSVKLKDALEMIE